MADQRGRSREAADKIARQQLAEFERKIADLNALRDELADLIGCCLRDTVAESLLSNYLAG